MEESEEEFNLGEILAILLEYKWLILAVTSISLMLGAFTLFNATPIYRANVLLQIEGQKGTTALQELQPLLNGNFDQNTATNAQLQILKSRSILGRVVDKLKLNIISSPVYLPYIGAGMARRHTGPDLAQPLFGLTQYAWGGEVIRVDSLEVPQQWLGEGFTLLAGDKGHYQLLDAKQNPVLRGKVGEPAAGKGVSLFVSQLKAHPGARFSVARISRQDAIGNLQGDFDVKERKGSGVVDATLTGTDAATLSRVLDETLNAYIRQNVEYRSAEAESTLKFLETQLPTLKAQVDAAETAYNDYRQRRGSVDLNLETQNVLASLVDVDKDMMKLQQERDELRQRFTPDHPSVQAMDAKLQRLKAERGQFNAKVSRLPDTQQTVLRLKRDMEVSNKLYTELLNSAQQLRVSKAGTLGDARIIDQAVLEDDRVSPNSARMLGISLLLGLVLSLVVIWVRRTLRVVVEDPDKIEKQLGLPVYATIPHSKAEITLSRLLKSGKAKDELLALSQPEDDAVESLRSLRTTIHFALLDASKSSLLITGPSQDVGKSFVAKNLGVVLAQSGKSVVIVDADLRKGHIHLEFGLARELGVSEFISGEVKLADILKPSSVPGLTVITTGQRPPNPSELLMHQRFEDLLEELGRRYDTVIVDAPPILAVSDAAIIGRLTGATLLVARFGMHPIRELEQAVKRLNQAGVQVKGFVFNDMDTTRQRYRYGYKGYVYRYSYKT
jgi:tyrosine-protein kinase Etk/Wzc